jgi:predicted dehydrogenase
VNARPYEGLAVGLVGCGEIVQFAHVPIYLRLGFHIRCVFDPDASASARVIAQVPDARLADSIQEIIDDAALDFIDVAIPPERQMEVALAAIKAGKHLLCQKPLAPSADEARRIVAAAGERGLWLVVNHQMRWAPFIRHTAEAVAREALGPLVHGRINWVRPGRIAAGHWLAREPRLLCLFNTIHVIDALRYLFGEPYSLSGLVRSDRRHASAGETTVEAWLQWRTGAVVSITDRVSARHSYTNTDVVLEFERGTMLGRIGLWDRYPLPSPDIVRYQALGAPESTLVSDSECWLPDAFAGPITELAEAILHGGSPTVDGENAVRNLELVDAIYDSSAAGRAVVLTNAQPPRRNQRGAGGR